MINPVTETARTRGTAGVALLVLGAVSQAIAQPSAKPEAPPATKSDVPPAAKPEAPPTPKSDAPPAAASDALLPAERVMASLNQALAWYRQARMVMRSLDS